MRHQVKGRHLGRTAEHRRALYRNLVRALFEHGRIRTTDAKAREVRPLAERMITLGKRGSLHARRQALRFVGGGVALDRLFGPIAERFSGRRGGYTRMVKAGRRHGDGALTAYLELVGEAPRPARASAEGEKGSKARKAKGGESATAESGARTSKAKAGSGGKAASRAKSSSKVRSRDESSSAERSSSKAKKSAQPESTSGKKASGRAPKREAPG